MTIISGTTVRWPLSPRLVEIPSTEDEVSVIDMHHTLQDQEDNEDGAVWPYLRAKSGGEALGGGVSVGFTIEYQNAKLVPGRNSSRCTGTITTGSTTQLIDSAADFVTDGVQSGDWVINFTDQSVTEVLEVVDLNTLNVRALSDGTDNDFDIGDVYKVWEVSEFVLTGGNHVSVDDVGSEITPVFPTFSRFVTRTSSSSATAINQESLEASTFMGPEGPGIYIDSVDGADSTVFPYGNVEYPCKLEANLEIIHADRGFDNVYLKNNFTITVDHSVDYHQWHGISPARVTLTLDAACDVSNNNFSFVHLVGKLGSNNITERCIIGAVTNANTYIYESSLVGPITISDDLTISSCFPAPLQETVTLDFDSLQKTVKITANRGAKYLVQNMVTGSTFHIDGVGGKVEFDSSCTGGIVRSYGGVEIINNGGTFDTWGDDTIQVMAAENVWDTIIESGYTADDIMRLVAAVNAGKLSGADTTNILIRDLNDTKNRVDATVDASGNRTGVVLDVS